MPSTVASEPPVSPPAAARPGLACENCGAALTGPYCARCGQHIEDRLVSVRQLFSHFLNHLFGLDNRLYRTLALLFRRPGRLTTEYLAGRRVRYVPPLRLYLTSSFLLFFVLALLNVEVASFESRGDDAATAADSTATPAAPAPADTSASALVTDPAALRNLGEEGEKGRFWEFVGERISYVSQNQASFQAAMLDRVPLMMFFLLPVFALLLKLLYLRSEQLYVAHFIFALHFHAFAFLIILAGEVLGVLLGGVAEKSSGGVALFGILIYLFLALRHVYGQGRGKTLLKGWLLLWGYSTVLGLGLFIVLLVTVLLL